MPILHLHAKDLVDFAELACVLHTEAQRSARSVFRHVFHGTCSKTQGLPGWGEDCEGKVGQFVPSRDLCRGSRGRRSVREPHKHAHDWR